MRTELRKQIYHARLIRRAEAQGRTYACDYTTDSFTAITELTVFAPNHPRLLSLFAGACAANSANIVGAHITTTRDGFALDSFLLAREFDHDEDESRRAVRIDDTIEKLPARRRARARIAREAPPARRRASRPSRWRRRSSSTTPCPMPTR